MSFAQWLEGAGGGTLPEGEAAGGLLGRGNTSSPGKAGGKDVEGGEGVLVL